MLSRLCYVLGATITFLVLVVAQQNIVVEENDPRRALLLHRDSPQNAYFTVTYDPWARSWDLFRNPITLNGTTYNNYFHGGSYLAIHTVGGVSRIEPCAIAGALTHP